MILYLLKASLCSALLLTLYELVLINQKTYRFNRFYLLFSLIFSAVVPLIDIELATTPLPQTIQETITAPKTAIPLPQAKPSSQRRTVQAMASLSKFYGAFI